MSANKNWMEEDNIKLFDERHQREERLKQHAEAMADAFVPKVHHPWCNLFNRDPATCKQCKGLYKNYPLYEGMTADDLQKKHFPNAIKRT